jgi:hypothetical protein
MQEPTYDDAYGKQKKHKSRPGHLHGPEQELDLDDRHILYDEENCKTR